MTANWFASCYADMHMGTGEYEGTDDPQAEPLPTANFSMDLSHCKHMQINAEF